MGFRGEHSTTWLFLSTVSRLNWHLQYFFLRKEEYQRTQRKALRARSINRTLRPQWWKASTLTTALSPLPYILTFSIKLMVISTGTIFPSLMQESIRSPFSEPLFLSSLNKSPADKWMYPNFWKINNTQNEFFPKQCSDLRSVTEKWNKKSSSMRKNVG